MKLGIAPGSQGHTHSTRGQWIVFSHYFAPAFRAGGPVRSLEAMIAKTHNRDLVRVVTSSYDLGERTPLDVPTNTWTEHTGIVATYKTSAMKVLQEVWRSRQAEPRLVYLNSLFDPVYTLIPLCARRLGIWRQAVFLLAPRGELEDGALAIKAQRKRIYIFVLKHLGMLKGIRWHATTPQEARNIQRHINGASVDLKPNDTLLNIEAPNLVRRPGPPRVAFVGRLSPVKGLDRLLLAVAAITEPIEVNIYGGYRNDEKPYVKRCEQLARSCPRHVSIRFHGSIPPNEVRKCLADSDLLALPTASENFGHAIVEALAASCPVMLARTTPWSSAAAATDTLLEDLSPDTWTRALNEYARRDVEQMTADRVKAHWAYSNWRRAQLEQGSLLDTVMDTSNPQETKRVALVTQGFSTAGGVQTVARWMLRQMHDCGYAVTVFDLANSASDPQSRSALDPRTWKTSLRPVPSTEADVHSVGSNLREIEFFRYLPRSALTEALKGFDLIQVVAGGPALACATITAGRPTFLQMATTVKWERAEILASRRGLHRLWGTVMTGLVTPLETLALRRSKAVFVENREALEHVRKVAPVVPVVLAPPGIDVISISGDLPTRASSGPIVALGRLGEPRKGYPRLIRAYARLRELCPDAPDLTIVGRGNPAELLAEIDSLGLSKHVRVLADLTNADVYSLLRSSSVFWQASYEEGLGIAVIEAMACGLPTVVTRTAGTEMTVVDGVTGFLIDQPDDVMVEQMAKRTAEILQGGGMEMSKRARQRALDHFSAKATFAPFAECYAQLWA